MPGARLSLVERAEIEVLFAQGLRFPAIAAAIGRDRSTVWREVRRNNSYRGQHLTRPGARHPLGRRSGDLPAGGSGGGSAGSVRPVRLGGVYRWVYEHRAAQHRYQVRARRPHRPKLRSSHSWPRPSLWDEQVLPKLRLRWSPRQISQWLASTYPDRPELQVSHETIYQAIYIQGKGALRAEISAQQALRTGRARRRPQSRTASGAGAARSRRAWLADFHISTRPAEATDRAVPGHWEGDLVIGSRGASAIITLVERTTRFVMLGALPNSRVSDEVVEVLTQLMSRVPAELAKTLTWDQGVEMRRHATFTLATGCQVYFCDPHSPWQRGSNENTNGLLRQYFPRASTDFRSYRQDDLDQIARELNGRPRQTLQWHNPAEKLNQLLVATTV
jgi:IS30 family transposase